MYKSCFLSIIATFIVDNISCKNILKDKHPNFIVILADDLGYGDIGCFRNLYKDISPSDSSLSYKFTPNIDLLGNRGIMFTRAYSCPWSAPSRQMLLSGLWANRINAYEQPWLGKRLRDLGYITTMIGKSHGIKPTQKCVLNIDDETAEFEDGLFFNGGCRNAYLKEGEFFIGRKKFVPFKYIVNKGDYLTDVFSNNAISFIKEYAKCNRPFFLYLAHTSPHEPLQGKPSDLKKLFPEKYRGIPDEKIIDEWKRGKDNIEHYAAMVYGIDRTIGDLVKILNETSQIDNTVIIFASDNGQHRGSSYPLDGHKWELREGGIRTPLIIWSKDIENNKKRIFDGLVSLTDIVPTLTFLAGERNNKYITDGVNILSLINNDCKIEHSFFYSGFGRPEFLDDYDYFFDEKKIIVYQFNNVFI